VRHSLGRRCRPAERDLASRIPTSGLVANQATVNDDLAKVVRFLDRPVEKLDFPLDLQGTPFQRRVREKLRAIPVGTTVIYAAVARWLDH